MLFLGVATFFLNFERQTITLSSESSRQTILEYHAPRWDPLPHYVKIAVNTEAPISLVATFTRSTTKNETYTLQTGEELITIYPEETLRIELYNPRSTTGTIKSELWCDSWNYAAGTLIGISILILLGSVLINLRQRLRKN